MRFFLLVCFEQRGSEIGCGVQFMFGITERDQERWQNIVPTASPQVYFVKELFWLEAILK